MKRLGLTAVFAALALGLLGMGTADAGYYRKCGSQNHPGAGWYNVTAHAISCGGAREVARHYTHSLGGTPFGFSCHATNAGIELAHIACRREVGARVQKVHFEVGA